MKYPAVSALLLACVSLCSCSGAHSQATPGGNEVFSGHYVWESYGTLFSNETALPLLPPGFPAPQQVPYIENGALWADGAGHFTQCSAFSSGMALPSNLPHPVPAFPGINCDKWTYTLQNFMGEAKSEIGDSMYIFCSDTGKKCVSVNNGPGGFAWGERMEKE
jgi:hypothetical protein